MEPLLSLPPDQFRAALAELQLDPQREADLVRQYRRANSPLAPIYGLLDRVSGQDAGQGMQRASMVPVARPEGMSVAEAVRSGEARLAVPQGVLDAIGALVGGIDAPGAAARGLLPAQDMPAEALGTAGVAMGGGGLLADAPADALGIFAGRRARTADLNALQRAEDMARAGSSRDDIWRDTGWFQGPDGQWRFEIDDSRMVMRQAAADALNYPGRPDVQTNLSGAILHQPLLGGMFRGENIPAAYDDMWGDVNIGRRPQVSGAYMPDTDAITVYGPDSVEGRDVMLHEIQHAIQNREGFARGSSPNKEMDYLLTERTVRLNDLARQIEQEQQRLGLSGYRPQHPDLKPLYDEYDSLVGRSISSDAAYDRYFRAAGEAESRNVSARSRFSPERRREIPPWETLDVPEQNLILPNYMQQSSANRSTTAGLLASAAETPAQRVARLLREGRASEVTDNLMAQADPQEMYRLYVAGETGMDLPMDEASRMARAREMGFGDNQYHATFDDFPAFMVSETGLTGRGVYTGDDAADVLDYARSRRTGTEGLNVIPLLTPEGSAYARRMDWQNTLDADPDLPYNATWEQNVKGMRRAADTMSSQGFSGVHSQPGERVTFNPQSLRSRFARFDPRLSHLANLNAANVSPIAGLLAILQAQEQQR